MSLFHTEQQDSMELKQKTMMGIAFSANLKIMAETEGRYILLYHSDANFSC